MLSYFYWNPSRVAFKIPIIGHPVVWYGVLFAIGFFCVYLTTVYLFKFELDSLHQKDKLFKQFLKFGKDTRKMAYHYVDQMTALGVVGVVLGARLGYILFYGFPIYKDNPLEILKIWNGGLASHGACIGILVALWIFIKKRNKLSKHFSFLQILDVWAIPAGLLACFIRIGNFINQEILGKISLVPWAVIFGEPLDGSVVAPRHPVQLYEALFYLLLSISIFFLWKKKSTRFGPGFLAGIFISQTFSFRFMIEFLKEPQGYLSNSSIQMGQWLSLPFVFFGLFLIYRAIFHSQQYMKSQL